jgi:Zn-dependent protease with chaperone function
MPTTRIPAIYFDGQSTRAQKVELQLLGENLHIYGELLRRVVPQSSVQWPERTRHGIRVAYLDDGASVQCSQTQLWDTWRKQAGHSETWVVKFQQSWRLVALSVLLLIAFIMALQRWGIPIASRAAVKAVPMSVDEFLGRNSLATIDEYLMQPSKLTLAEQEIFRAAFERASQALPIDKRAKWQLYFRKSKIGPNAFALPGGVMVMTDELVELVNRDEQIIMGVLAHELGHVHERHGMRMVIQVTGLGAIASLVLGDFSTILASVPTLLGQASYSREAEKEADTFSVDMLRAAKISPAVMVTLFEKLSENKEQEKEKKESKNPDKQNANSSWLGIAFSSHPASADRIAFFKQAAENQNLNRPLN